MLTIYFENKSLYLENINGKFFLLINNNSQTSFPLNLWSKLRMKNNLERSYKLYIILRKLEKLGWIIDYDNEKINEIFPKDMNKFTLEINRLPIPLILYPDKNILNSKILSYFSEKIPKGTISILIPENRVDEFIANIKLWLHENSSSLKIILLEEPYFNPILVSVEDGSLEPKFLSFEN